MDPHRPPPHSLSPRALTAAGWAAFLAAGAIFLALAWNVSGELSLVALDSAVASWMQAHRSAAMTALMFAVTHSNSTLAAAIGGALLALVLARMREWYWVLSVTLAVGGGLVLNVLLKHAFERARPHFHHHTLVSLETYSFPSGHTAGAVVFYGVLAAFLVSRFHDRRLRAAIVAVAIGAVCLVALSRVYLGAHYLSDVVAAACSSTVWLVLCLNTVHGWVRRKQREAALSPE